MPTRVLVVDDDPDFRGLASRIVGARDGVKISEADTVAAAIDVARRVRPDAAIVDVGLPDGDGVELARQLCDMPWEIKVVLISSDPDAVGPDAVRASGALAFFPKDKLSDAPLWDWL